MPLLDQLLDLDIHDLQATIAGSVEDAIEAALGTRSAAVLRDSDHADFQADFALSLARARGANPRDLAGQVVASMEPSGAGFTAEISGPGFLNITVEDALLMASVDSVLSSRSLGVPLAPAVATVVVDYSAPNVAKEMHVGHLRSTVIGDAIVRMLELVGHRVIRQNHIGDWGTPFGMLIEHLLDLEATDEEVGEQIADLDGFYRAARKKFDADAAFANRARARVVKLQAGDEATLEKWKYIVDTSAHYFQRIYDELGVKLRLADVAGESSYNDLLTPLCDEFEARGWATIDDGALCTFPPGYTGRSGDPLPLILRKSDGGFGYATTDLAALRWRVDELGASLILYVVGAPQKQHLEMVFASGREAGWLASSDPVHVPFGSVLGRDGKVFKTRSGETIKLENLLGEAEQRARDLVRERNPAMSDDELESLGRSVGMAAVKFADLRNHRTKDYVFDLDAMVRVEGDTGPYVQYTHARARAVLNRLGPTPSHPDETVALGPHERSLALAIAGYPRAFRAALVDCTPHVVCNHLIRVARAFNAIYAESRMLGADDSPEHRGRVYLTLATAEVLRGGLATLGIDAPYRV